MDSSCEDHDVDNSDVWAQAAKKLLDWQVEFQVTTKGTFQDGNVTWFPDGSLNACYNCVDRWALVNPNKPALIYEADEINSGSTITFHELLIETCKFANALTRLGVQKGDTVVVYMPMIPQVVIALLACARLGAIHSCVFAGFSAKALQERIEDCSPKVVITADEGRRGGKTIPLKTTVDEAVKSDTTGVKVVVAKRTQSPVPWNTARDIWWHKAVLHEKEYCAPAVVGAEDPLFILYTSGSTGKPKGLLHTTGGYLLGAALATKYAFDLQPHDRFGCVADVGWITGHTYVVYGPLLNGVTTLVFEATPTYPGPDRFWQIVERHRLTQLYTAPTTIRTLQRFGDKWAHLHDLSSLRLIASIGEPLNSEALRWCFESVGKGRCTIMDTYFQTETGGMMFASVPSPVPLTPGSVMRPLEGVEPVLVDSATGSIMTDRSAEGLLCFRKPWPWMARTIWRDHRRFLSTYFETYKGLYFTGDGASRDPHGHYYITGRVDDVVNVSGHRLSTAEIESALATHIGVAESAVVGIPDQLTGQALLCYVTMKKGFEKLETQGLVADLRLTLRQQIGSFAVPKFFCVCSELPQTRSGKIMRRILRKIAVGDREVGDVTSLIDPTIVGRLRNELEHSKLAQEIAEPLCGK